MGYAILTMVIVIFLYDQILFRPLIAWSEKFKMEQSPDESEYQSWLIDLIRSSRLMKRVTEWLAVFTNSFVNARWLRIGEVKAVKEIDFKRQKRLDRLWTALVLIAVITGGWFLLKFILAELKVSDIFHVFLLGAATGSRVIILILLSSMLWIPVGVWIGLRPRLAQKYNLLFNLWQHFQRTCFILYL